MNLLALLALAVWAVVAAVLAGVVMAAGERHGRRLRERAYSEILAEKGVERRPDETMKQALLRARREESIRPFQSIAAQRESARLSRNLRTPYAFTPGGPPRPKLPSRH